MIKHPAFRSGFSRFRFFVAGFFCLCAILLSALSFAAGSRWVSVNRARGGSTNTASSPGWSLITSPNALTTNNDVDGVINDVGCFLVNSCFAVGNYLNGNNRQTLIEHWSGGSWSIITSPSTSAAQDNYLNGVNCPWPSNCFAVGSYVKPTVNGNFYQTLIEAWDGLSWSIVQSPNVSTDVTVSNQLTNVTCNSTTDCFAVGYYANGIYYPGTYYQTLIEHWDGSTWSIIPSPNASTTADNYLYSVSCISTARCFAVGFTADNRTGIATTLIEQWNGISWSIVTSPNTGNWNQLYDINCVWAGQCFAAGRYLTDTGYGRTLIEQWNGTSWSIVPSPNNGTFSNSLNGIGCTSLTNCFAIGGYFNAGDSANETLIEQWNGTSWSIVASPNGNTATTRLAAVTCPTTTQCSAVGSYQTSTSGDRTFFEQWNGSTWSILNSLAIQTADNRLNNVTCASTTNCFAVGDYLNGTNIQTLIEQWNGSSWSIVASPNAGPLMNNIFYGVTCSSSTQCFAAGWYIDPYSQNSKTLIERWDGTSWSVVPSPNTPSTGNGTHDFLYSVACTSDSNCFAVGSLIEHWDGTSWSIVASPTSGLLNDVSCNSATDCFAVGSQVEHWDGTSWSVVSSPYNNLFGAKCTSTTQCFAVGYRNGPNGYQTAIEKWDGSAWSISNSANTSATEPNVLYGVDCASSGNCWSVGYHGGPSQSTYQTLIEHWDGTGWSIVASPNGGGSFLIRVACASSSQCWAVGEGSLTINGNTYAQTLIEEYSPTITPLVSVGSRMTHGPAGTFDVNLPLTGSAGIECRSSNSLGAGNYSVVFNFVNNVTSCGSAATAGGTVVAGPNTNQCTMNLTGIADAQTISVELDNVVDAQSNTGNVSVPMGVLFGDASGDGLVNVGDTILVRNHSGETATSSNFREDLNADGLINVGDTAVVRSHSGDFLP